MAEGDTVYVKVFTPTLHFLNNPFTHVICLPSLRWGITAVSTDVQLIVR
jgi:hypothetical protein